MDPFRAMALGAFVWMRCVDLQGGDEAYLELVRRLPPTSSRETCASPRAVSTDWQGARAIFRLAQTQGLVDVLLASSDALRGAPEVFLHQLVCVDPSARSAAFDPASGRRPQHAGARFPRLWGQTSFAV